MLTVVKLAIASAVLAAALVTSLERGGIAGSVSKGDRDVSRPGETGRRPIRTTDLGESGAFRQVSLSGADPL